MAFLHILTKLEKSFPKAKIVAITVDEGIRGYREEALKIAKKGCQKLGVEHTIVSFKELFGYAAGSLGDLGGHKAVWRKV